MKFQYQIKQTKFVHSTNQFKINYTKQLLFQPKHNA